MFTLGRFRPTCHTGLWTLVCVSMLLFASARVPASPPGKTCDGGPAAVPEVQLDVIIALVKGNLVRTVAPHYAKGFQEIPTTGDGQSKAFTGVLDSKSSYEFLGLLQYMRNNEGSAKTMSYPSLTTKSGTRGTFFAGREQAVPVPAGPGSVGGQLEEIGTRVNYLPVVLGNGKIFLEVEQVVTSLDAANGTVLEGGVLILGRDTNKARMTVEMEVGQTLLIGGLTQQEETITTNKIPVLSDLPIIGPAFQRHMVCKDEAQVVILLTPYLVDPKSRDAHGEKAAEVKSPRASKLVRLERQLKKLQAELDDLHGELISSPALEHRSVSGADQGRE